MRAGKKMTSRLFNSIVIFAGILVTSLFVTGNTKKDGILSSEHLLDTFDTPVANADVPGGGTAMPGTGTGSGSSSASSSSTGGSASSSG